MEIKGIPFDAPLYDIDPERGAEYHGCEGLAATFFTTADIASLLPEGLRPTSDPPTAAVWIAYYPFSTVGAYYEQLSAIQVEDDQGEMGYFVPYIYVTNDAALAAGREILGAPKKLAHIHLTKEFDLVQGSLERPSGKRLLTLTVRPTARLGPELLTAILPKPTPMYSVRHLPPIGGKGGTTQLVRWWADVDVQKDSRGDPVAFAGPLALTYDSPSPIDPVHRLGVSELITAMYFQFDMKLGATTVVREW